MVEEECKKFKNDTNMKKVAGNQNSKIMERVTEKFSRI